MICYALKDINNLLYHFNYIQLLFLEKGKEIFNLTTNALNLYFKSTDCYEEKVYDDQILSSLFKENPKSIKLFILIDDETLGI